MTVPATPAPPPLASQSEAGRGDPVARGLPFVAAITIAAFLLFSLELLSARLVLPVFGGSPAVWTTSLCFFTGILFVGYAYAHAVATRLSPRKGGLLHAGVTVTAVVMLLVAPSDIASLRVAGLPEALNVLLVLALIAAGPAFVLASTTPLFSAWYAGRGRDPWWLYAVSNGASLLALLAYPFLIEPSLALSAQRVAVLGGLAAYAALLALVVLGANRTTIPADQASAPAAKPLGRRRQGLWLAAAAVPAGLLAATTNFLQTDLVSAPLIWVLPLGAYLASFVIAFSRIGRRLLPSLFWLVPAAATLLWVPFVHPVGWPINALLIVELGAFSVVAVTIHGRLALDRPDERHLTRFYLILSGGGLIGTAFVALLAPLVFSTIYEYPLLIIAGLVVLAAMTTRQEPTSLGTRGQWRAELLALLTRALPYAAASVLLYVLVAGDASPDADAIGALLLVGAVIVVIARRPSVLAIVTPVVLVALVALNSTNPLVRERNFFGVLEVRDAPGGHEEFSGTTIHGFQFTDSRRGDPTSYYVRIGPLGEVFDDLRARTAGGGARVGVVGLGAGTIAAYAQPGDQLTFFEINQDAVDIAQDPRFFTYLSDAAVRPQIVLGDARLSLEGQAPASFDVLILDAFISDAVPAHLLTREAMQAYMRLLRPGGILAYHLSNRYYNLTVPVGNTARSLGLSALTTSFFYDPTSAAKIGARNSTWLVVGHPNDLTHFAAPDWSDAGGTGPPLTDDYSDLTRWLRFLTGS